ncbi:TetR/AcrR family transcriptional regulator [Chelativorans sp. J32]|uniref:TetR/AcrR family transcriptional regulator n=1 Tax=Chelativorans sp. J32 TaxID=935840 RepID=UPI000485E104|nr:TetR/AcrR family transcriptional regulator [Chelativorans sp. J32]
MSQDLEQRKRGRPPSLAARAKALRAAHDILMNEGFGRLTIEAVAAKSGVSKPTIYRHWSNASELAMAALMIGYDGGETGGGGSLEDQLLAQMRSLVTAFATTRGRQIALTLAASDPESEMTKAFRNRVILSSRERGRELIEGAVNHGSMPAPEDIEVLLDMLYAPVFYRLLLGHLPLSLEFADSVVRAALAIMEVRQKG